MKKRLYVCYSMIFFLICVTPLMAMFFVEKEQTSANEIAVEFPKLKSQGAWNSNYFEELGEYVNQNFAGREFLVTANAKLMGNVLKTSTNEKIIRGKDGWLFFQETAKDYLGQSTISQREAFAIAKNLETIKAGIEKKGGKFFFTIAPNKSSLYGEFMPENYLEMMRNNNYTKLQPYLDKTYYVDLFEPFRRNDEVLYYKWDSHWNQEGALFARNILMDRMGKTPISYENVNSGDKYSHKGDLYEMAYPKGTEKDRDVIYDRDNTFIYKNEVRDNDEPLIETKNQSGKGRLIMYRDSFGTALLPFMADEYHEALFSKEIPYQMNHIDDYLPGDVVLEIVERNLASLCENAPILEAPEAESLDDEVERKATEVYGKLRLAEEDGDYMISGEIDRAHVTNNSQYLLKIKGEKKAAYYQPFYLEENKFSVRISKEKMNHGVVELTLFCFDGEQVLKVSKTVIRGFE